MEKDDNRHLLVSKSDNIVRSFYSSEYKDEITEYKKELQYYEEDELNNYYSENYSKLVDEVTTDQNIYNQADMKVENNITADNDE